MSDRAKIPWDNFIMRKYGGKFEADPKARTIHRNIHEALIGSSLKAFALKKRAEHEAKNKENIEGLIEYIKFKTTGRKES